MIGNWLTEMNDNDYDNEYFASYLKKSRFSSVPKGEKSWLFNNWLKRYLKSILNSKREILEVGCGLGFLAKYLEKEDSFKIIGLDVSEYAIKTARNHTSSSCFLVASAEKLPFKPEMFHCVIALDVVEHLRCPENFVSDTFSVLKNGGIFLLRTPNLDSYGAKKKGDSSFIWMDKTHINVKRITEWREILRKGGFSIIKDGTDTLWDVPYWKFVPPLLQRVSLIPITIILNYFFGFLPWHRGENYFCLSQKK